MTESENIDKVVQALRQVPAKNLLIIELANKYTVNGQLDHEGLSEAEPEVNLAIAEARMYGSHTLMAVSSLLNLEPRADDVGP